MLNQSDKDSNSDECFEDVIKHVLLQNNNSGLIGWVKKQYNKFTNFFNSIGQPGNKTKKILIIDEIDVLFNKNYFGDTFNQSI